MAVPVVVQASTVVHGSAVGLIEVTLPTPVTVGNSVVLIMVASSNISGRTYTITDTSGWGGWSLALMYNPNTGGTVHYRHNCPAQTNTIRITQSSSTFSGSFIALEVSGLAATGIITTGTHSEASARTAHTCSSVATTGTDCFVACFSGLTATAGGFGAYGAGYTGGYGANTRCIQYKVTASHNDAGPWTTTGTARIGMGGMVIFPNAAYTPTMTRVQGTGKARIANSASPLTFSFPTLPAVGNGIVVLVWGSDAGGQPLNFANGWVTDNQGNEYTAPRAQGVTATPQFATCIYYCAKVKVSSGTFTISVSAGDGRLHWWVASAVEVGGLGLNSLSTKTHGSLASASSATASSGPTDQSITGEIVLAATMCRGATTVATSIVAETVSPAWVVEAEELDGNAWMAGEAVSRITSLAGVTATATWTQAANATSAAVIVALESRLVTEMWRDNWYGKVRVGPVSSLVLTTNPSVGNGIIIQVLGYRSTGMTFGAMTDNAGHTYTLVGSRRITTNGEYAVGIFFLPRLLTDNGANPVLVTLVGVAGDYYTANVTEIWTEGGELAVETFVTNSGTSATPTTTATAALTGEYVLSAAMVKFQSAASIVAQVVSPVWVEEMEELDGTNWVAGEGNSRIVLTGGATAVGNWTLGASGNWAAMLVAFRRAAIAVVAAPNQMGTII